MDASQCSLTFLPDSVSNLVNLVQVDLRKNRITTLAIPAGISSWRSLQRLVLAYVSYSFAFLSVLFFSLLFSSFFLLYSHSRFRQNDLDLIPDAVFLLSQLQELDLSANSIYLIGDDIGNLTNLRKLLINQNKLTALPRSLRQLNQLSVLECR